jgi:hypothetical protein
MRERAPLKEFCQESRDSLEHSCPRYFQMNFRLLLAIISKAQITLFRAVKVKNICLIMRINIFSYVE